MALSFLYMGGVFSVQDQLSVRNGTDRKLKVYKNYGKVEKASGNLILGSQARNSIFVS